MLIIRQQQFLVNNAFNQGTKGLNTSWDYLPLNNDQFGLTLQESGRINPLRYYMSFRPMTKVGIL